MSNSTQLQLRRGTAAECNAFTGAIGEVVVDTTNNQLRLHDGVTIGGHIIGGTGSDTGSGTSGEYGIPTVDSLSDTGISGQMVVFDSVVYIWDNDQWKTMREFLTSNAPDGIVIVTTLPTTGTEGQVVFLSGTGTGYNKLYRYVNGSWVVVSITVDTSATIADASITLAKFAQGITPVGIVDVLPTTGNFEGRIVFYTVDNKLYRYTGTAWTSSFNASDITGTITSTQIGSNQIATSHLQANSITSTQIAAGAVVAGKVAAGAISTTELAAGAVRADNLYAGAVTADKIAANAITATKIAAGAITAEHLSTDALTAGTINAGSIGADQLAAYAITSDKLAANSVTAGAIAAGAITANKISVTSLSAINANCGTLTSGIIQSANWSELAGSKMDLTAGTFTLGGSTNAAVKWDGSNFVIRPESFKILGRTGESFFTAEDGVIRVDGSFVSNYLTGKVIRFTGNQQFDNYNNQNKFFPLSLVGSLTIEAEPPDAAVMYYTGDSVTFYGQSHYTGFHQRGLNCGSGANVFTFCVQCSATVDDQISIYYQVYDGGWGSWTCIGANSENQSSYGATSVVGVASVSLRATSMIRFSARATDASGNKYGGPTHKTYMHGGLLVVASNVPI